MIEFLLAVEVIAAIVLTVLNIREVLFLRSLSQAEEGDKDELWLLAAIAARQTYLTFVGIYLLLLSAAGAVWNITWTEEFPWMRPLNGLIFLGIIAGPFYLGHQMRKKRTERNGTSHS